jgi:hypothetical protein
MPIGSMGGYMNKTTQAYVLYAMVLLGVLWIITSIHSFPT